MTGGDRKEFYVSKFYVPFLAPKEFIDNPNGLQGLFPKEVSRRGALNMLCRGQGPGLGSRRWARRALSPLKVGRWDLASLRTCLMPRVAETQRGTAWKGQAVQSFVVAALPSWPSLIALARCTPAHLPRDPQNRELFDMMIASTPIRPPDREYE